MNGKIKQAKKKETSGRAEAATSQTLLQRTGPRKRITNIFRDFANTSEHAQGLGYFRILVLPNEWKYEHEKLKNFDDSFASTEWAKSPELRKKNPWKKQTNSNLLFMVLLLRKTKGVGVENQRPIKNAGIAVNHG